MLTFSLLTALIGAARAQDEANDIERFRPASDHFGYLNSQGAETLGHLQVGLGVGMSWADDPLVLAGTEGERVTLSDGLGPVHSRLSANAHLGLGITNYFSLSATLPVVLTQSGYDVRSLGNLVVPPQVSPSALGDVRVMPMVAPVSRDDMPLGVALAVPVSLPTGDGDAYAGVGGVTVQPTVIVELSDDSVWRRSYSWRAALNLGYLIRPEGRLRDVPMGSGLTWGAALGYRVADAVELTGDLWGQSWGGQLSQNPVELGLGSKFLLGRWTTVDTGLAFGVVPGVGAPDLRGVVGVSFAPSFDVNARDIDRDGVPDGVDRCPKVAEDDDGYQDDDGCPDTDNDGDGIEDGVDTCPNDPEDDDGYHDQDGCPDTDNDQDGLPDVADRCPDQAETINGYEDRDGCPDDVPITDADGDGFLDDVDRCPYDAEDRDGFEDDDGCPDEAQSRVQLLADRIEIRERVYFDANRTSIKAESFTLLDEVAAVIVANPQLLLVRVEGHTDTDGDELSNLKLSQGRAKAVMEYLVKAGVAPDRLASVGFGESTPIDTNDTEEGKANNRRVEFIIVRTAR